jgi:hypothetical protein
MEHLMMFSQIIMEGVSFVSAKIKKNKKIK